MPGEAFTRVPGQDMREHVESTFAALVASLVAEGHDPVTAELVVAVTDSPDAEVEIIRAVAKEKGLGCCVFVDDQQPPRPGTVPSSALDSDAAAGMAEARAQRILNS